MSVIPKQVIDELDEVCRKPLLYSTMTECSNLKEEKCPNVNDCNQKLEYEEFNSRCMYEYRWKKCVYLPDKFLKDLKKTPKEWLKNKVAEKL